MFKNMLIAFTAIIFLSGCTGLSKAERLEKLSHAKTSALATSKQAPLVAITAGEGVSMAAGQALAILLGGQPSYGGRSLLGQNTIMEDNNIKDPAIGFAKKLAPKIAKKYKLRFTNSTPIVDIENVQDIAKAKNSDLVLVVKTTRLESNHFRFDYDNYRVTVDFSMDLKDGETGKTVAYQNCSYFNRHETTDDAPTWDDLYENGAKGFQKILIDAQNFCADDIMEKITEDEE